MNVDPGYFTEAELKDLGFRKLGRDVRIARDCIVIGTENIALGDNVRVDSFCTLAAGGTGWIRLGSHIHVGGYSLLAAGAGIEMEDFSGLSHGVRIYSQSDDYSGKHLTNPTIPVEFRGVHAGPVKLARHVIIGSGTIILPDLTIGEGSAVGALAVVSKDLSEWGIFAGNPARRIRGRSKDLLGLERAYLEARRRPFGS